MTFKVFPMVKTKRGNIKCFNNNPEPRRFETIEDANAWALKYLGAISWADVDVKRTPDMDFWYYFNKIVFIDFNGKVKD